MGKDITVQGDVGSMGLFLAFPIDQSAKYFTAYAHILSNGSFVLSHQSRRDFR